MKNQKIIFTSLLLAFACFAASPVALAKPVIATAAYREISAPAPPAP